MEVQMKTKQKKVRPQRDMNVPLMRLRNGGGAHTDHKKKSNRNACRNFKMED
jgi:hypothetical protein